MLTLKTMTVPTSAKISLIHQKTKSARNIPNKLKLNNRVLSNRKNSKWQQRKTATILVSLMEGTRKKWTKNKRAGPLRNNLRHSMRRTPSCAKS